MGAAPVRCNMIRKKFIKVILRYGARLWCLHFGLASSQRLMNSESKNFVLPQLLHANLRAETSAALIAWVLPSDAGMSDNGLGLKYPQIVGSWHTSHSSILHLAARNLSISSSVNWYRLRRAVC